MLVLTSVRRRVASILIVALLASFVAVPTSLAATAANDAHGAQAVCRYMEIDPADTNGNTGFRLNRLAMLPPTLFGKVPGQTVGWRFVVQRWYSDWEHGTFNGPWKRIFASTVQKAVANPDQAAAFSTMFARIRYVDVIDRWPHGYSTSFRSIASFYWYNGDGSIARSERFVMQAYPVYRNGVYQFTSYGECEGAWLDS